MKSLSSGTTSTKAKPVFSLSAEPMMVGEKPSEVDSSQRSKISSTSKAVSSKSLVNPLTAKEVCDILMAAAHLPLKQLRWGDVVIECHDTSHEKEKVSGPILSTKSSLAGKLETNHNTQQESFFTPDQARQALEEMEDENLMISDPLSYEDRVANDFVYNGPDHSNKF